MATPSSRLLLLLPNNKPTVKDMLQGKTVQEATSIARPAFSGLLDTAALDYYVEAYCQTNPDDETPMEAMQTVRQ